MKRLSLIFVIVALAISGTFFSLAYAVDNNCLTNVNFIFQTPISFGCFEDRIDALENAPTGNESTECINLGSQYQIILNSTDGNCFVRSLANGTGIIMSVNSTHVIVNSTSSGGESTVCTNLGSVGEGIYVSGNCDFKKLLAGTDISLSSNGTRITITNTAPDNTVCTNVGSGTIIYKDGECNFKTLVGSADISITNTSNTVVIDFNGSSSAPQIAQLQFSDFEVITKTNIGNAYVDIYNAAFNFEQLARIYGANVTYFRISYQVDYVGAGTQQYRWVDANNNANVLAEASTITSDCLECTTGWFVKPAFVGVDEFVIEMQGKSTTATDDPIVRGYQIHAK